MPRCLDVVVQQLAQQLERQVLVRHVAHLGQELVGQKMEMSGLLQPGGGEDVDHLLGRHGPRDQLADGAVQVGRRARWPPPVGGGLWTMAARTAWKNADLVAQGQGGPSCGTDRAKACVSSDGLQEPLLAVGVVLGEDVLLRPRVSTSRRSPAVPVVQV